MAYLVQLISEASMKELIAIEDARCLRLLREMRYD